MATIYGVVDTKISQGFGPSAFDYSRFGITRNGGRYHDGEDLAGPAGTPFYAPEDGSVYQGVEPGGWGNFVIFTGKSGYVIPIAHLSRFGKNGQVKKGDIIGYRGTTGNSTGNHFHITVYPPKRDYNNGVKGAIPPVEYFNKQSSTPLPYTDRQYSDAKAAAINGLYWRYMDRGATENDVKTWLNANLNDLERRLQNPDDPISEEHRLRIIDRFKLFFGKDRKVTDAEIRQRTPQNLLEIDRDFIASDEFKNRIK